MQEPLKVALTDEDSEQLKHEVFAVMSEAVQQVRDNAIQAPEWFKGKNQVAAYLDIDTSIVTKMIALGLPTHHIELSKLTFFKKSEVDAFILNDGFINQ
ncbi:hypothetical protein FEZ41_04525 [Lentilactobacillus parafarraginis]|uniref:Uncharacterized protein n=1 Tax=Lentilactobacillus parafarraginis TaxID=390842 RepID=A0A5R9CWR3_9LACO|nr:hypothetical protein [Lentilactobacillus parafarraginis]TLQ20135.1 hypothetical protein FEZ41_04525 [Lentilactobacillus parafarraginis]